MKPRPATLCEMDANCIQDVAKVDASFLVDSRLRLHAEDGQVGFSVIGVAPFRKRYPQDSIDYAAYLNSPGRVIYLAYADGQVAGLIRLRTNWNRYAYVEDIAVDVRFRRRGIGRMLLSRAIEWARGRGLPGVMLETQDNNVAACKLYQSVGFQLGGFDRLLYRGLQADTQEVALYWYLVFPAEGTQAPSKGSHASVEPRGQQPSAPSSGALRRP